MGGGGKINSKGNFKKRIRSSDKCSDDSDEDYVVEDEGNMSDDDFENSLDEYASEESYGSFVEEEEEEVESRKINRSRKVKGSLENGEIGVKTSRRKRKASYEEEVEEDDEDYVDNNDEEDEDDEEFTPDEDEDCLDEDVELTVKKKNSNGILGKRGMLKKVSRRGRKRRRKSRVSKKPSVKKGRSTRRLRKKERCEYDDKDDADFMDNSPVLREKSKKSLGGRRRYKVYSDSDVVSSGSSNYEYTISEEEREQVREANELCGDLRISMRSLSSMKRISEDGDLCLQGKLQGKKGKEKVKELKSEVVKQVCGICLSEEDKRRLRGTLNCCSHYFCFTCIMEWSKVESRCPLCKQRFKTITKNGRSTVGVDLRNVVIQVPKRDQVYQPSEEEIRSFIDPYENVICTECHEGWDDGLMLLCDLCDSPAHTYCVGLGRQVPEGNWYCDGCRPVALGSSSSQGQDPLPGQRTMGNNMVNRPTPILNLGDSNPVLESSARLTSTQGFGSLSSPTFAPGDVPFPSPLSGGAATLSMRRQLQRHIQHMFSINRMNLMAGRTAGISAANLHGDLSNSQIDQGRETAVLNSRTREFLQARLQDNHHPSPSVQNRDFFPLGPSQLRSQVVQGPTITADRSVNLTLWPDHAGMNSILGHEQSNHCNNRSSVGPGGNLSPYRVRGESQFYVVKEQVQSMVRSHLKSLSQEIEIGHETFKEIARSSTHTILAACGLEHKKIEVRDIPSPSVCTHFDRIATGQTSMMKGFCSSCFDLFVRDVVKSIMDTRTPPWLSLGL